jgi:hypothetical protein
LRLSRKKLPPLRHLQQRPHLKLRRQLLHLRLSQQLLSPPLASTTTTLTA